MQNSWAIATVWMGLALLASFISIRLKLSTALVEILTGIAAGNLMFLLDRYHFLDFRWSLEATDWIKFLAGFGSILLTFIAGAEIEPNILRRYFKESMARPDIEPAVALEVGSTTSAGPAPGSDLALARQSKPATTREQCPVD
jgi:Kef-type K+ transport system membrane component KefB